MSRTATVLDPLSRALAYEFRDPALLQQALTHRSAGTHNYERLEFLGDGLINFLVGLLLFEKHPGCSEGDLTYARSRLVREEALAHLAAQIGLGDALVLDGGVRKSGGFRRDSILADSLEAVFGAIYLDGGLAAARAVCERLYGGQLDELPNPAQLKDAKTRLQEWLQGRGRPIPVYEMGVAQGAAHRPQFTVACRLADSGEATEGAADTRKGAEQVAAARMLEKLGAPELAPRDPHA
jgi:ribonuclease-3